MTTCHVVLEPVTGSLGMERKYPAVTRSSNDCGDFNLSAVYWSINVLRVCRLLWRTASRERMIAEFAIGIAILTRIETIVITIISSINVNPEERLATSVILLHTELFLT